METPLAPLALDEYEDEREDGEIVDDDFEDISDYSIASGGKSDLSEGIIRAISLSSISGESDADEIVVGGSGGSLSTSRSVSLVNVASAKSDRRHRHHHHHRESGGDGDDDDGEESAGSMRQVRRTKRRCNRHRRRRSDTLTLLCKRPRKRRRAALSRSPSASPVRYSMNLQHHLVKRTFDSVTRSLQSARKRPLTASDEASSDSDVIDKTRQNQLNKAVRVSGLHVACGAHNSLKDRLKRMIHSEESDERTVISVTNVADGNKDTRTHVIVLDDEDDDCKNNVIVLRENSPQRRRLDSTNDDKELEELRLQALKSAMLVKHQERKRRKEMMNKENTQNAQNYIPADLHKSYLKSTTKATLENVDNIIDNVVTIPPAPPIEEALELPLPETKQEEIQQEEKVKRSEDDEIDVDIMRAMLLASMTKKITENPPPKVPPMQPALSPIILPPVKPLIIRFNPDSESETTDYECGNDEKCIDPVPIIENSVEEFLRKQREEFEANLPADEPLSELDISADKSFLKLLPQSQQQEYKRLKQKLLEAKKNQKKPVKPNGVREAIDKQPKEIIQPTSTVQTDKKNRSTPKGKYKELAPLLRRIQAACEAKQRSEALERELVEELQQARAQKVLHRRRHAMLLQRFKQARAIIDMRSKKLEAAAKIAALLPPQKPPPIPTPAVVKETVFPIRPDDVPHQDGPPANDPDVSNYVSPLDSRNAPGDPQKMLCPFELFGVCKDPTCTFNHCP